MAIEMQWENPEQTVFFIAVVGNWTLDEYYTGFIEATKMMNRVDYPITMIIDMSKSSAAPAKFLSTGRFAKENRSPNIDFTVMVGMPAFAMALMKVLKTMFPAFGERAAFVATMEEARQVVGEHLRTKV